MIGDDYSHLRTTMNYELIGDPYDSVHNYGRSKR